LWSTGAVQFADHPNAPTIARAAQLTTSRSHCSKPSPPTVDDHQHRHNE
jgi:hypothetical protein